LARIDERVVAAPELQSTDPGGQSVRVQDDDDHDLSLIRRICLRFPDVEQVELQNRPLFRVHTKRFALFNGALSPPRPRWQAFGRSLHFLSDTQERPALSQDPRFVPSPHHGDRGWLALNLEGDKTDWNEVAELLESAYRQVASRALIARLHQDL
jgi:predicted DNA-binding protein (MmcQ/YjbR family)